MEYIDKELTETVARYERWKKAYEEEVITLAEYKEYRYQVNKRQAELSQSRADIERKEAMRLSVRDQRKWLLAGLAELRAGLAQKDDGGEIPFQMKRHLFGLLLDRILVDSENRTVRFEGRAQVLLSGPRYLFCFRFNPS